MSENFFKTRRDELKLTQWDVANAVGTKGSAPGQWERAESCPRLALIPALAQILQTSEDRILKEIAELDKLVRAKRDEEAAAKA